MNELKKFLKYLKFEGLKIDEDFRLNVERSSSKRIYATIEIKNTEIIFECSNTTKWNWKIIKCNDYILKQFNSYLEEKRRKL